MTLTIDHESLRLFALHDDPFSLDHIKRIGALNSELANFLKPLSKDFYHKIWDFDGDALVEPALSFFADANATPFDIPATQELGGIVSGATGTTDNDAISILGPAIVNGDNIAVMRARFKVSAVTSLSFEIGFVNAVTDKTLPVVTDVDTPATGNGGTDLAVVHMDTDQTLKTMAFVVDGSTSGMNAQKENIGVLTPTADTYMDILVGVYGNNAVCNVNGKRAYRKVLGPDAIEGGTLLRPWLYFRTRTTASRTVKVDRIELFGGR
jgi:hypothetical protein